MNFSLKNPRVKLYLTMGVTMALIFTLWIVTLAHTLKKSVPTKPTTESTQNLKSLEEKLSGLFADLKDLKSNLAQTPTTTGATLQGGPQIKPEELDQIIEQLGIATSTPTSTLPTDNTLKVNNK
jgi:hypothetical protein